MKELLALDTEKLLHQIADVDLDALDTFVDTLNLDTFSPSLWLDDLIKSKQISKSQIASHFGGTNYIYEICNGSKAPSRNKLLEILIYIKASLQEIQFSLRVFEHAPLYPKNQRDLYILYAIKNNYDLLTLNTLLNEKELTPLSL